MQINVLKFDKITKEMIKTFGIGERLSGVRALAQHFIIILFSNPGTDFYYPNIGGGLSKILASNYNEKELQRLFRNVAIAVMRTKEQIIQSQVGLNISDSEKLKSATILDSKIIGGRLKLRIYIQSQSGSYAIFPVGG